MELTKKERAFYNMIFKSYIEGDCIEMCDVRHGLSLAGLSFKILRKPENKRKKEICQQAWLDYVEYYSAELEGVY